MRDPSLRRLRRHLDSMPLGYPAAPGRVDLRILERLFSPREALLVLFLDWKPRVTGGVAAAIARGFGPKLLGLPRYRIDPGERAWLASLGEAALFEMLAAMARKGAIMRRRGDSDTWELMPFIVGMFEFQVPRMDKAFFGDTLEYLRKGYGFEFVTSGAPQTRVIPIRQSIPAPGSRVASYEELDSIIEAAGDRIALLPCICRKGADLMGKPCRHTERREICMALRDYADMAVDGGWGRKIGAAEARELAALNQAEGFVIELSNEASPQFICACCPDCCGPLGMAKATRRAADVIASATRVRLDPEACIACGLCAAKCPLGALSLDRGRRQPGQAALAVDYGMCLGCGVCVPICPRGALSIEAKPAPATPQDSAALMEAIASGKRPWTGRVMLGLKALLGIPRKGGR